MPEPASVQGLISIEVLGSQLIDGRDRNAMLLSPSDQSKCNVLIEYNGWTDGVTLRGELFHQLIASHHHNALRPVSLRMIGSPPRVKGFLTSLCAVVGNHLSLVFGPRK
jgi:hypothetical protein